LGDETTCDGQFLELRYTELFPQALRRRNQALPTPATTGATPPDTQEAQDTLGFPFQTESGFYKAAANGTQWPEVLIGTPTNTAPSPDNTSRVAGQSSRTLGLADHGTRLIARFNNVQNGVQIWVTSIAPVLSINAPGTPRTGTATLTTSDANGAGGFGLAAGEAADPFVQVPIVGGTGQAVWEIINADTTALERVEIEVVFVWTANTTNNLPALGTSTVNGNLAPLSTTATASSSASIPRFVDSATPRNLLTINSCRSNLLFPFVTNQAGFDTGLAISNTSQDPFGTALQTGTCTINYYGRVGTSQVTLSNTSASVTGGEHFTWTLSTGGAVPATAGFQGYIIAQCNFQYAHGFAFISNAANTVAEGYLALVMDDSIGSRTGSRSETLGH
jgi:hypothetical protein